MRIIREIEENDLDEFMRITLEAFPGMRIAGPEERQGLHERLRKVMDEPIVHFLAVWEGDQMVGVMRFYDFTMKLHSTRTLVGGVGGVAVDLRHKKERVAADIVNHFIDFYRRKEACLTALYPFRPDFYRRMGYGYGLKMNRYRFKADSLPSGWSKEGIDFLTAQDKQAVHDCYDRFLERTNGLIELPPHVLEGLFSDPAIKIVGLRKNNQVAGYLVFRFETAKEDNFLLNHLYVRALIYDDVEALRPLIAFLRSQADQVDRIIYETQDDMFFHLLADPRNGSGNLLAGLWHETNSQGIGIMYRVIDVPRLFAILQDRNFGGVNCRVAIDLTDSFRPEIGGRYVLNVTRGDVELVSPESGRVDCVVTMDISTFSSLAVGAIDFSRLVVYGLASVSDPACVAVIDRMFHTDQPPLCMTSF